MTCPHTPNHTRTVVAAIGATLLTLNLSGCDKTPAEASAGGGMPPPVVTTQVVVTRTIPLSIELPALLAGSREVEIRARVAGILEARNFVEGSKVTQGQSLYTLDTKPFEVAMARIDADLAAAQARRSQAVRNLTRLRPLRKEGAVAQKDFDDAISAEAIASADVTAAEAHLREARLDLEYARVESPIAGVVGRSLVSEGTLVSGPELLLTQVTQMDPVHVRFGLSELEQQRLRKDAETGLVVLPADGRWLVRIKLVGGTLYAEPGVVNFSDVRVDASTGTSEMQAVVPNPNSELHPGQFVRVLLTGAERRNAIVVPQRAVLDNASGKYVYLLVPGKDGKSIAQQAPIEVGDWVELDDDLAGWVVRSGLKPGDQVIVDGVAKIFVPGSPVVPADSATSPNAG